MPKRSDGSFDINFSCRFEWRWYFWALSDREIQPGLKLSLKVYKNRYRFWLDDYWPCRMEFWTQRHLNQHEKLTAEVLSDSLSMKTWTWEALALLSMCLILLYIQSIIQQNDFANRTEADVSWGHVLKCWGCWGCSSRTMNGMSPGTFLIVNGRRTHVIYIKHSTSISISSSSNAHIWA